MGVFPKINPTTIPPIEAPVTPIIIKGIYPLIDFIRVFLSTVNTEPTIKADINISKKFTGCLL